MSINKELAKGSTALLVLSTVSRKEMYGYQIIQEIAQTSGGVFHMNEGTLYPILHMLEKQGLLEAYWEERATARKRKYYRITSKGLEVMQAQTQEWETYATAVRSVLLGGEAHAVSG